MSKVNIQQLGKAISNFTNEVASEFRRTTWPDRRELVESTVVVVSFIVILSAVVLICDRVIQFILKLIHS